MALAWDRFTELQGDPRRNLEVLTRSLVQREFGHAGQIRSRRNQPGVEFHLRIIRSGCGLGDVGRWFGWQCKWYDLTTRNRFRAHQRRDIEDAISKAKEYVPGLTDFVLVLRQRPAAADLDWYDDLDVGLELHLWADEELDAYLTGGSEKLRSTFFGDLAWCEEDLANAHERSVNPIRMRWLPDLHVVTSVEHLLDDALVRPASGEMLRDQAARLDDILVEFQTLDSTAVDQSVLDLAAIAVSTLSALSDHLELIGDAIGERRPEFVAELLAEGFVPQLTLVEGRRLARRTRNARVPNALLAGNVVPEIRGGLELLRRRWNLTSVPMVAVVGLAGQGKTQLAAELTSPRDDSPAGIFIMGSKLRSGFNLDDLARNIPGLTVETFDDLLEAVDAAAARRGVRIPIVIDGLNEAERPAEWNALLAEASPLLPRYPGAQLIVTLRGERSDEILPDGCYTVDLEWQEEELGELVARYLEFYLIDLGEVRHRLFWVPDPLFFRMFCEAANGQRQERVGVESLPTSLVAVFESYLEATATRLRSETGRTSLRPGLIEKRLRELAGHMWTHNSRDISYEDARELIDGAEESDWDDSLYRRLEEEGVLMRHNTLGLDDERTAILFDRFAGYLIADWMMSSCTPDGLEDALSSGLFWEKLGGDADTRHPFAGDILVALVGVVPRQFSYRQLWKHAPTEFRSQALRATLSLESEFLDSETVEALADSIRCAPRASQYQQHEFDYLWEIRDGVGHRLNAAFLDRVLSPLTVAERDLSWTEWVRVRSKSLAEDLEQMQQRWEDFDERDGRDDLTALAAVWLLTSTDRHLRDAATLAIQRYGRSSPGRLFALTERFVDVNDPYVLERVLAASTGAALMHQMPDPGGAFEVALTRWLHTLADQYLCPGATSPMLHYLSRGYVSTLFEFAEALHPSTLPASAAGGPVEFHDLALSESISDSDERAEEVKKAFGMDFENYVIGRLYSGRGNYQSDHVEYSEGVELVRGRVWQLGWRHDLFGTIDREISGDAHRPSRPGKIERYGKKYNWIAYYELAGWLDDKGRLLAPSWRPGRPISSDIDPTFPSEPAVKILRMQSWTGDDSLNDEEWMRGGTVEIPINVLVPSGRDGEDESWILVEAYLSQEDEQSGRSVFGFVRGLLVNASDVEPLFSFIAAEEYLGNNVIPECPSDDETFAGEIPWSARFGATSEDDHQQPYQLVIGERSDGRGIAVELLGHEYAFQAQESTTNLHGSYDVASKSIAVAFGLRQLPGTLDLVALDGQSASQTRRPSEGWQGNLLYLRRKYLHEYAGERHLIQVCWGERRVESAIDHKPEWLEEVWRSRQDQWVHTNVVDFT